MLKSYLEITFRRGKPLAAYLYLPRHHGDVSVRTVKQSSGLLVDYAQDGRPIGIEIPSPSQVSLHEINAIVSQVDEPADLNELAPLRTVA